MIRINLLPADLRRGNRLPPKVMAAAFAAALLVSAAVGWFGLVYFGDLASREQALQKATAELEKRKPQIAYHDQLVANKADYELRVKTIQEIGQSRRVWSQFLDELIDVVNNNGDVERHVTWFDSITVKGDPAKGMSVRVPGNVQGDDKSRLANFHEDLAAAPFAPDLVGFTDPEWTRDVSKDRLPPEFLRFPMELQFQPATGKK